MPQESNIEPDESNLEDILLPPPGENSPGEGQTEIQSTPEVQSQGQAGEPPVPSQPAVSSLPASLVSRAKAAGLPLDNLDSTDKLAEYILDRYSQERPYADFGRSALANQGNQNRQQEQQVPDDAASEPQFDLEGHYSSSWQSHKLDAAAEYAIKHGIVELGEDGLFRAKEGYEAIALPVLNQVNQAHLSRQEQVKNLFEGNFYQNLDKVMWPAFEHRMKEAFEQRLASQFDQYRSQQEESAFVDSWQKENKHWLVDAQGNLSPDGVKFRDTYDALSSKWNGTAQELAGYVIKIAGINTSNAAATAQQAAPAQQPSAAQTSDGRPRGPDGKFLPANQAPPPTKQETFIDRARRHSAATESRNLGVNNNSDYQVANEGELENMFMSAWKQAAVG